MNKTSDNIVKQFKNITLSPNNNTFRWYMNTVVSLF